MEIVASDISVQMKCTGLLKVNVLVNSDVVLRLITTSVMLLVRCMLSKSTTTNVAVVSLNIQHYHNYEFPVYKSKSMGKLLCLNIYLVENTTTLFQNI